MQLKIQVILGSVRPGRTGEKVAAWAMSQLSKIPNVEFELIDLKDWNLPIELDSIPPSHGNYTREETKKWAKKIGEADGYIFITPEYNHSTSAALKNALDHIYGEWNKKPVAMIGYGSAGGARAVEHLRLIAIELQMAPTRSAVHIMNPWSAFDENDVLLHQDMYNKQLETVIEQLLWWTHALKNARAK